MTTPEDWPVLDEDLLLRSRVFDVQRARARSPRTGEAHDFHRLLAPDWVNVIPVTAEGRVVMVRQYRHGARRVTLEIPGGMVDPGESAEQAAGRELREETGYEAGALSPLGVVNPNPALFDNLCHTYLAEGCEPAGEVDNQGAEETHVQVVGLDEVPGLMRRGVIDHALVVAAFHWLGLRG